MTENHETVTVELSGQQQSVTVEQGGQGGSGETGVVAAARDVSMSEIDIPVASEESLGGVKVGRGLAMDGEALGVNFPEDGTKFLRGDGEWSDVMDERIGIAIISNHNVYPILCADRNASRTGDKVGGTMMYNQAFRPVLNMATGTIYAVAFSGSGADLKNLNGSEIKSGQIRPERIESLPASKIASGTLDPARLPLATQYAAGAMSAEDKTLIQNLLERVAALEARLNGD